jgi:hypothetical protein
MYALARFAFEAMKCYEESSRIESSGPEHVPYAPKVLSWRKGIVAKTNGSKVVSVVRLCFVLFLNFQGIRTGTILDSA